jgi:filamentous hemagglutinin
VLLDGGKYNTVNGFDHVFITEIDGVEHVMIVDTKQLKNGSAALNNTNNGVQLSEPWVDNVLANLDYSDAANTLILDKIQSARTSGTLMKGVAGLDKQTGEFSVVKLAEGY